jgi:steroid delta-isomerase-like uncharacterized protein
MQKSILRATTVALFLCLVWTHSAQAQNDADKIRLIQEEASGWSRNMDQLLAVFTDDVIYEDNPLGSTFRGKEELRAFAQGFFNAFPDLKAVITSTVVSGDRAASEWRFTGTQTGDLSGMPASNKQMDLRGVSIYEFEGGKIKRKIDYWDMATMLKQLGFMPAK